MESAGLGFEFHDSFAPVGLSSGDDAASSDTDESIALVECLLDTLNKLIVDDDYFADSNKRDLETQDEHAEGNTARVDNKDHQKTAKWRTKDHN